MSYEALPEHAGCPPACGLKNCPGSGTDFSKSRGFLCDNRNEATSTLLRASNITSCSGIPFIQLAAPLGLYQVG